MRLPPFSHQGPQIFGSLLNSYVPCCKSHLVLLNVIPFLLTVVSLLHVLLEADVMLLNLVAVLLDILLIVILLGIMHLLDTFLNVIFVDIRHHLTTQLKSSVIW